MSQNVDIAQETADRQRRDNNIYVRLTFSDTVGDKQRAARIGIIIEIKNAKEILNKYRVIYTKLLQKYYVLQCIPIPREV